MPVNYNIDLIKKYPVKKDKLYTFLSMKNLNKFDYKLKSKVDIRLKKTPYEFVWPPTAYLKNSLLWPKPIFVYDGKAKKELKLPPNSFFKKKTYLKFKHFTFSKKLGQQKKK